MAEIYSIVCNFVCSAIFKKTFVDRATSATFV